MDNNEIKTEETPIEMPQLANEVNNENSAQVNDINNLQYDNVLKPGEELDDFHYEQEKEVVDTKFLRTNILSIITIILCIFIPIIPILLAILSLNQIKKTHEGGKIIAIIGIVINVITTIISVFIAMYVLRVGPYENKLSRITEEQMNICQNSAYGCDNDEDKNDFKTCSYCADDVCQKINTIECPTQELIEKTKKENEERKQRNLDN